MSQPPPPPGHNPWYPNDPHQPLRPQGSGPSGASQQWGQPPQQGGWNGQNPPPAGAPQQARPPQGRPPQGQPPHPQHPTTQSAWSNTQPGPGQPRHQPHLNQQGGPTVDPRRPMGAQQHASVSIDSFTPPKNRAPLIITVVVVAVVLLLGTAAWFVSQSDPTPKPTSTASSPSPSAPPSDLPSGTIPFHSDYDDADGYWAIVDKKWTDKGLELTMTLEVTKGTINYQFFCLDNDTTDDYDPEPSGANSLNEGTLNAGDKVKGVVIFDKPKGDTTVILAGGNGRQITALIAEG